MVTKSRYFSKRIIKDMVINIAGTGIPLVVLQLIIYPIVARRIDENAYGEMQAIMSVLYLLAGTLGGALSTTRLIRQNEYETSKDIGDFNSLASISLILLIIITPFVFFFYLDSKSIIDLLLITILSAFLFLVNYYEVGFRLQLNYVRMFITKVLISIGYGLGFCLFSLTFKWQFIFIMSYAVPLGYVLIKTDLIRESFKWTKQRNLTIKNYIDLVLSSLLSKSQTYFDKLLLYPLLGGAAVSVYFAANIFGKLILQTLEPITNVILSYLSKKKTIEQSLWKVTFVIGSVFCILLYFVCIIISGPVLRFFYPQWAVEALTLVPVATASLSISSFLSIIYPFTLKALNTNRQIIINGVGLVVYVVCVLLLYKKYYLIGCCFALLISYISKLLIIIFLYLREINDPRKKKN